MKCASSQHQMAKSAQMAVQTRSALCRGQEMGSSRHLEVLMAWQTMARQRSASAMGGSQSTQLWAIQ